MEVGAPKTPDPPGTIRYPVCGPQPFIDVKLDGIPTIALVDTGSQVSTVTLDFYEEFLATKSPIIQGSNMVKVFGITGHEVEYEGCALIGLEVEGNLMVVPFLVVPSTHASAKRPALLGTNALS